MSLKFYNTYSKSLEEFKPLSKDVVAIYNCGPTVYDHPHIGNFRSFLFADVLKRYLEFKGYKTRQIMNITDVGHLTMDDVEQGEDKLEAAARKQKLDPWAIAKMYSDEFFELLTVLNVKKADLYPRATDHVQEMIKAIEKLIEKGYAYVSGEGVYYRIRKFKDYGKLSGNTPESLVAGKRIPKNPNKEDPLDFALWKLDPKHIMKWPSPWGEGFPGWHIECSVMSVKYLGETLDIHTGGEDNIFPHHESEIAQSESCNGKQFVRYWMHARHLLVGGSKMSKSAGNFYTVKQILNQGYRPQALRFLLLSAHYRSNLNFTFDGLESSGSAVDKLVNLKDSLEGIISKKSKGGDANQQAISLSNSVLVKFEESMDDDLNIAKALGYVFDFVGEVNRNISSIGSDSASKLLETLLKLDSVIGCIYGDKTIELTPEQERLIRDREDARKKGDFSASDKIRDELKRQGIQLIDSKDGTKWKKSLC
ncbi:MAG: cysteine--tRNA ligase [Planctomycetes bacterium]|nr:cysteine--tRNA ligase [Planctomycetota bacterium]